MHATDSKSSIYFLETLPMQRASVSVEMHTKQKRGELFLQEPPEGPFNHEALQWHAHAAYIPYHRVKDFICGEENRKGFPTKFYPCQKHENTQGSLKRRVDGETYLEKICYHCSYGPDFRTRKRKEDPKGGRLAGDQREALHGDSDQGEGNDNDCKSRKKGSKKWGCLCNFEVRKLYMHPLVARLTYECFEHVNPEGVLCHGTIDSSLMARPSSVTGPGERNRLEGRERQSEAKRVVAAPHAEVVIQSKPGVPIHFRKYKEILRIESRLKTILYNHPSLMTDYCSLLEELEEKLNKTLANKQTSERFCPPAANLVSGFGLNVKEALEGKQPVTSIQYPPAPPMRFPNSGSGIDWLKVLASKGGSGPIPPPAPPLTTGSDSGCDWKKILGGRQSVASIYIPPAPPIKENPGGFDWEKALAETQNSSLSRHLPSSSGSRSLGSGFSLKHFLGRSGGPTVTEIPPVPHMKNLPSVLNRKQFLEGNQRLVSKSAEGFEEYRSHGSTSKRHRLSVPSKLPEQAILHPVMLHNSLPTPFSQEKTCRARTPSDVEEMRDSSEDTSSA